MTNWNSALPSRLTGTLGTGTLVADPSFEWSVHQFVRCQWFSVAVARTFRRSPHNIRLISIVWAPRGCQTLSVIKPQSRASWSWYSSSEVDLMLMSRNRANSFELAAPHPSTMLKAMDSAALVIWNLRDPFSLRGKIFTALRTPSTSSCDRLQTRSFRKSCIRPYSTLRRPLRRHFSSAAPKTVPCAALITTDDRGTDALTTQNLDPLSRPSDFLPRQRASIQ